MRAAPGEHGIGVRRSALAEISDGTNVLVIARARLLLREIELEGPEEEAEEAEAGGEHEGEHDEDEFETGPVVLELNLDGALTEVSVGSVPPGTYDELELEVHRIDLHDAEDAAAAMASPGVFDDFLAGDGASILVDGTWNGEPFRFASRDDEEREIDLSPPIVIGDGGGTVNVTIEFDVARWFRSNPADLASPLLDPRDPANHDPISDRIEAAIEGFEDDDHDGHEDDHDD
jgi:hypothetical protein